MGNVVRSQVTWFRLGYIADISRALSNDMVQAFDLDSVSPQEKENIPNSTYCMKVSMSMTVEESDEGRCFSSKIRHLEKAEITHSKMVTCPDIEDYMAPYKQPHMTWYKECERVEWRSSIMLNTTHLWIPEVEEGDGGNYTCELQYGSRVVRRTTQLKVTDGTFSYVPKWDRNKLEVLFTKPHGYLLCYFQLVQFKTEEKDSIEEH
ncbi:unnamed protein product [Pleuronectes platessa]|uniref:Ig-like domain-containing protein n=1 Tax=Pleuronectes platessa TaxID=8262 RepID=A0A9N7VMW1_PLEPL|nr:unnamed protein product [Pleuronectes platessa]